MHSNSPVDPATHVPHALPRPYHRQHKLQATRMLHAFGNFRLHFFVHHEDDNASVIEPCPTWNINTTEYTRLIYVMHYWGHHATLDKQVSIVGAS